MRILALALVAVVSGSTTAPAQTSAWAEKMFGGNVVHDFGSVPHGAHLFHRFPMTNIWAVPIELTSVRVSCGCVTATPTTQTLQPRESGFLDVTMDAHRFTGLKSVTIYVTLGPQYTSTAALRVSANSRVDVVFNPGQVSFGVVPLGQTPVQVIDVEYAGVLDWRVSDIDKGAAPLDVRLEQLYREPGKVGYRISTTLKTDAPAGLFKQELMLRTNDPASPLVPVLVEAIIQAPLSVKPSSLAMGNPKVGEAVSKRVIVHGGKPFKIVRIDGLGNGIQAEIPPATAEVHTLTITFQPESAGPVQRQLQILTDLTGQPPVSVTIEGNAAP
jgi:hypothetical protein